MISRSVFDFSSWQCPCNSCKFLYSSLPPAVVGLIDNQRRFYLLYVLMYKTLWPFWYSQCVSLISLVLDNGNIIVLLLSLFIETYSRVDQIRLPAFSRFYSRFRLWWLVSNLGNMFSLQHPKDRSGNVSVLYCYVINHFLLHPTSISSSCPQALIRV